MKNKNMSLLHPPQLYVTRKLISKADNLYFFLASTIFNLLVVVFFTNLAPDTYLHLFLNLLTHPASSCPSLSLPSLTFTCFLGPSSLSLPLCLCVNREACLNFLQLRAATPHFDDFAVKADILRINIWFHTCIICACGGTLERNREESQCKLSSKIALEKWHHSCGRLEASFLGFLPGKAGQGDKVSGVNHCSVIRLWLCWCQRRLFPFRPQQPALKNTFVQYWFQKAAPALCTRRRLHFWDQADRIYHQRWEAAMCFPLSVTQRRR